MNRCYNGSLVAFCTKEETGWRLGTVSQLHYLDEREGPDDGSIGLWKWNLVWRGVSSLLRCSCTVKAGANCQKHMEYNMFRLEDITLHYLNQIKGQVPLGLSIQQDTRNHVDGAIQLSPDGPDLWRMDAVQEEAAKAHDTSHTKYNFKQFKVGKGDSPHPNLLMKNTMKRRRGVQNEA